MRARSGRRGSSVDGVHLLGDVELRAEEEAEALERAEPRLQLGLVQPRFVDRLLDDPQCSQRSLAQLPLGELAELVVALIVFIGSWKQPLDVSTDGKQLIVAPAKPSARRKEFEAAQEMAHKRYGKAFQKLAE